MKSFLRIQFVLFFIRFAFIVLMPFDAIAQPYVDLLNVKMQMFAPQPYTADAAENVAGRQTEATFLLPMEQKNKDVLLFGGDYTQLHFQTNGTFSEHSDLYSTSLLLGYDHQLKNAKWRTTLLLLPKINSDFKDISGEDYQVGGVLMFNYKQKENLKYHFGLYYNREFFGDYFIPLLGIDWKINDKMNLFGDLPNTMNFEYKFSHTLAAGAALYTCISSYRLNSSTGGMYVREGDKTMGHDEVKVYLNAYLTKHAMLFAEAGQTFYRTYTLYNKQHELQDGGGIYRQSRDGMFVNMGFAYRFRLD